MQQLSNEQLDLVSGGEVIDTGVTIVNTAPIVFGGGGSDPGDTGGRYSRNRQDDALPTEP